MQLPSSLYQFGFRKNHVTKNALTEVTDYIYKSLESNIMEYVELLSNDSNHVWQNENNT